MKRPFTMPSEATILFSASTATLSLGPCGRTSPPDAFIVGGRPVAALYHLPAGEYFLRHDPVAGTVAGQADASATLSTDCSALSDPSPLAMPNVNVSVAVPASTTPWFLALPSGGKIVLVEAIHAREAAVLCPSCGASACTDATRQAAPRTGAGDTLRLTPDPAQPFSQYDVVLK